MGSYSNTAPRVYVGTYAKYNNGSLAGCWFDLEDYSDLDEFLEACQEWHDNESYDPDNDPEDEGVVELEHEFMYQDWEGVPDGMITESSIRAGLWDWLELDDEDRELLAAYQYLVDGDGDLDSAREAFQSRGQSPEDFCEELAEEMGDLENVPDWIRTCIDWEQVWKSGLRFDYVDGELDGELWIFRRM